MRQSSVPLTGAALLLLIAACSSAPKPPAEIFTLRHLAETNLKLAVKEADRGNYTEAWEIAAEARRLAVSADDPPLLVKTGLAQGNILWGLGRRDEAEAAWGAALAEAERAGLAELEAVCRVHQARGRLLDMEGGDVTGIRAALMADLGRIKTDQLAAALAWTVIGMAERQERRWAEAEGAFKKALAIHDGGRYLEQCAYDWYLIASTRSLAGDYEGALEALERALEYDRRAEYTYGIGKDWLAVGDVNRKFSRTAQAESAYRRALEIFRAANLDDDAAEAERRLEQW